MLRSLRTELRYRAYRKLHHSTDYCAFCDTTELQSRSIYSEQDAMVVVSNSFPYTKWAGQRVKEHLMIIPKRHILSMEDMTTNERQTMIELMIEYETKGYSFYIRSQGDTSRSVGHIHGHLFRFF